MNNQKPKIKQKKSTVMIRILFYLHGKCEKNPNIHHFKIDIKEIMSFPMAFKYSEDYDQTIYEDVVNSIKENPIRLIHHLNIKESGYYEMVANINCTFIYDENNQLIDQGVWKIDNPMCLQLTEEESEKIMNFNS